MDKDIIAQEINAEYLKGYIYSIKGVRVMLDMDLAKIYGYSTKDFNRQVKNNIEKFEQDFMFQLSDEECEILRCKNSTSSWGGRRYNPYAFTEQGIYMLMTVLKGDLATKQSKALIRIFKQMKDYIVDNQPLLGQREYLQLSLQTTQNTQDLLDLRKSLSAVDDKVADIIGALGNVVTKSELANVMLDFGNPSVRRGWLILNGQPVESDLAYQQIYATAKKTIFVVDNYIGLKTLVLLKDVPANVMLEYSPTISVIGCTKPSLTISAVNIPMLPFRCKRLGEYSTTGILSLITKRLMNKFTIVALHRKMEAIKLRQLQRLLMEPFTIQL